MPLQVWIRRKDYHILTGGKANYIKDQRFQVLHQSDSSEWTLQIRFVQAADQGTYECQVCTLQRRDIAMEGQLPTYEMLTGYIIFAYECSEIGITIF